MILKLSASLVTQPKFMVPRHRLLTSAPCAPRRLCCTGIYTVPLRHQDLRVSIGGGRPRLAPMPQRVRTSDRGGTSIDVPVLNFTWMGVLRALYAR